MGKATKLPAEDHNASGGQSWESEGLVVATEGLERAWSQGALAMSKRTQKDTKLIDESI
jgi:hypothetical protein